MDVVADKAVAVLDEGGVLTHGPTMTRPGASANQALDLPGRWAPGALAVALGCVWAGTLLLDPRGPLAALSTGPSVGALISAGAKVDAWVAAGQVYRLVIAGFLHGTPGHLLWNAVWLWAVSRWAAGHRAPLELFAVWILGATAGHLASFAVGAGPSVGASGAAFAVGLFAGATGLGRTRAAPYLLTETGTPALAEGRPAPLVLGLCNEMAGYIVPEPDYVRLAVHPVEELFGLHLVQLIPFLSNARDHYEETVSLGPSIGSIWLEAAHELLGTVHDH